MAWGGLLVPGGNDGLILARDAPAVALCLGGVRGDVRLDRSGAPGGELAFPAKAVGPGIRRTACRCRGGRAAGASASTLTRASGRSRPRVRAVALRAGLGETGRFVACPMAFGDDRGGSARPGGCRRMPAIVPFRLPCAAGRPAPAQGVQARPHPSLAARGQGYATQRQRQRRHVPQPERLAQHQPAAEHADHRHQQRADRRRARRQPLQRPEPGEIGEALRDGRDVDEASPADDVTRERSSRSKASATATTGSMPMPSCQATRGTGGSCTGKRLVKTVPEANISAVPRMAATPGSFSPASPPAPDQLPRHQQGHAAKPERQPRKAPPGRPLAEEGPGQDRRPDRHGIGDDRRFGRIQPEQRQRRDAAPGGDVEDGGTTRRPIGPAAATERHAAAGAISISNGMAPAAAMTPEEKGRPILHQ